MKTKYTIECRYFRDIYDYSGEMKRIEEKYDDYAIAKENAIEFFKNNITEDFSPFQGDFNIIAITIDENAFTYEEKVVYKFDYKKQIERFEHAEKYIDKAKAELEKAEKEKAERIAKKKSIKAVTDTIERCKEWIEKNEKLLTEKPINPFEE